MAGIISHVLTLIEEFMTRVFAEHSLHVYAALVIVLIILAVLLITMWTMP